ncbi:hypothetical protein DMUE_5665, partial [Dictyocoela muelleri]
MKMENFFEGSDDEHQNLNNVTQIESCNDVKRKTRQSINRSLVECFLGLLNNEMPLKEMLPILNVSMSTLKRLYNKYLAGEYLDLTLFKSSSEKKTEKLKNFSFEQNIIASEIQINPCIGLETLSQKLKSLNNSGSYSLPTVSRIIKKMNYSRKTLTLVPINRNSSVNKEVRARY